MKLHLVLPLVLIALAGCGPDDPVVTSKPRLTSRFPDTSTLGSKAAVQSFMPIPETAAISKASLDALEARWSCQLPDDYSDFLLTNNGAFPTLDCVIFEEADQKTASDVFCFLALNEERPSLSIDWHWETYFDRLPKETLPIARDSNGNLWLMSVRDNDSGSVYFWDHGSFDSFDETDLKNWPKVGTSFTKFRDSLCAYDPSFENDKIPSRYSLVIQAANGMAKRDASFSSRSNSEFVWHCDCEDGGKVKMQFVQYEVHAIATHTCGYTRLRAIRGLIADGQSRLPK
jgi:hypothetical protein